MRIYLPLGYQGCNERYPVLYMHDGQNLFDTVTSYSGEWRVDKTLNELSHDPRLHLIVVGIDHGDGARVNELSPWSHPQYGAAEGDDYLNFITDQLRPFINLHYRTKPEREHTAIMGSSMGGLMTHYAVHRRCDVFGKAGIFSPSYWFSEEVFKFTKDCPVREDTRLYFLMGLQESDTMVGGFEKMVQQIEATEHPAHNLLVKTVSDRGHSESFWAEEFSSAVRWLFTP